MLRRIPKVLLLVALLMAFVVSGARAFADKDCTCFSSRPKLNGGGCQFDKKTSQCINISCDGFCQPF